MIGKENLGSIMGAPVVDPDDDRIGTVGQVFVDPTTGAPNWVTVHTGLFGRHETFVPLGEATWDREVLHVPYRKDLVKDAPRIHTDEALTPQAEDDLYRYYRMGADETSAGDRAEDDGVSTEEMDAPATTGESVRLRKFMVTEEQTVPVHGTEDKEPLEADPDAEPAANEPAAHGAGDADDDASDGSRRGRHRA